jgi:very-short-patch-repair endonuclease
MAKRRHQRPGVVWALAENQHGVVARAQLLDLGFSSNWIHHRIAKGRLHQVQRGVYAVGRPGLTRYGSWMAAVLSCGPEAALSHVSAAELWELASRPGQRIEVSVPEHSTRRRPGIAVHRRAAFGGTDLTRRHGIPVTTPTLTLIDLATCLNRDQLEAAINDADRLDLVDPETLRAAVDASVRRPGVAPLRKTLDRRTFTRTDTWLERRFLPIARRAGLPPPMTQQLVNGFRVDFYWPDLGLVVETDGLRHHRTPAQQARDRIRDQVHTASGLTPLRFTRAQIKFEPRHLERVLAAVAKRLLDAGTAAPDRVP